ncbi:MAG: pilus assembly protein [Planctomycetales bacterium]|nr:pilus assembly protein [Planctomycetales bacterium]
MNPLIRSRSHRRGAAAVEFAVVAAPLFLFVFASIEFGRALMGIQSLEEAARAGCRRAILRDATFAEIESEVDQLMATAGIDNYSVQTQPSNIATAEQWDPVSVTVSASFGDMSWLPMPMFLGSKTYLASATLPKEYETEEDEATETVE